MKNSCLGLGDLSRDSSYSLSTPSRAILRQFLYILHFEFERQPPRSLMANDRHEEALNVMAKYHGEGDRDSPIVQSEYREILDDISITGSD